MNTSKKDSFQGKISNQNIKYPPLSSLVESTKEKYQLYTPKISDRIKEMINSHQQTYKMKMKRQAIENTKNWFYKTEIKAVSINMPILIPKDLRNQTSLEKISIYVKAAQLKLQQQSEAQKQNKKIFEDKLETIQQMRKYNILLKKKVVHFDMNRKKMQFLVLKSIQIKKEFQNDISQIHQLQTGIARMKQSIKDKTIKETEYEILKDQNQKELNELNQQVSCLSDLNKKNSLKIREISISRMPNQRNIINQIFLVGILFEQIYILDYCKSKMAEIDLSIKKVEKQIKQKQKSPLKIQNQQLNRYIKNRTICINCLNSEIVVFKILTVIYMHCKSLFLNNISSLMNKTSYFSNQFKQIYDFKQFDKYMSALIKRYKESIDISNKSSTTETSQLTRKDVQKLIIVSNEDSLQFIRWILKNFEVNTENIFSLRIGKSIVEIELITVNQLKQRFRGRSKQLNILNLKFYELNNSILLH